MIRFQTRDGGEIAVDPETIITFPVGLPGFEGSQRFKLFHDLGWREELPADGGEVPEHAQVYWLQSLDDSEVVFSVVDPGQVGIGYQVTLSQREVELLQLNPDLPEEVAVLMILTRVREGEPEGANASRSLVKLMGSRVRPHILGPLFINVRARLGIQKVLTRTRFTINVEELP